MECGSYRNFFKNVFELLDVWLLAKSFQLASVRIALLIDIAIPALINNVI